MCSAPELRAQTRPGASVMCAGGWVLTGNSLPGLSQGPWNQVQASEAPPDLLLQPNNPLVIWGEHSRSEMMVTCLGGAWGMTAGETEGRRAPLTLQV